MSLMNLNNECQSKFSRWVKLWEGELLEDVIKEGKRKMKGGKLEDGKNTCKECSS
jgi:hypothetical protein